MIPLIHAANFRPTVCKENEMMKALTIGQLNDIYDFVQKNHRFCLYISPKNRSARKKEYPFLPEGHGFGIKYLETSYDSRDGNIWNICFRQGNTGIIFATNHFVMNAEEPLDWRYDSLYELCMAYLKGEFIPTEDFKLKE